ncbi:MAG: sulfite exporter TauE/SafE family protein, partial [Rhodococcus sp. (in: high G+C Gram-positive bacteria)]
MTLTLALGFGVVIGILLGLLGGGGSILAVPVLVFALGMSPTEAVAVSLIVV